MNRKKSESKRRPYIWTRALSYEQFRKIEKVKLARYDLSSEVAEATRFARCQIRDLGRWDRTYRSFDGVWQGKRVNFDPVIRPLFMEYAARLYECAAIDALGRFPGFADHMVENGSDIGERRLVFASPRHELAKTYMIMRMWSLDQDKKISVAENFRVVEEEPAIQIRGYPQLKLYINLDRPLTDETTWEEVRSFFAEGREFPLNQSPRQCDFSLAGDMRCEMSLPELACLNWDKVRKPLTKADKTLFNCLEKFDPAKIARCLAAGADPNAIGVEDETPIARLSSTDMLEFIKPRRGETWEELQKRIPPVSVELRRACIKILLDAGAHIDLCGLDGCTAVVNAVLRKDNDLLAWLLEQGADDTIECFTDSDPGEWPTAWDYAASDISCAYSPEERELAEQTWELLRKHRQTPEGWMPGERPDC